jgi:hypothetical protein
MTLRTTVTTEVEEAEAEAEPADRKIRLRRRRLSTRAIEKVLGRNSPRCAGEVLENCGTYEPDARPILDCSDSFILCLLELFAEQDCALERIVVDSLDPNSFPLYDYC